LSRDFRPPDPLSVNNLSDPSSLMPPDYDIIKEYPNIHMIKEDIK